MRSIFVLLLLFTAGTATGSDIVEEAALQGDIDMAVRLDANEQSGEATATVRIHADRQTIWPLITTCADALALVPGMVDCSVLETAPDHSWQRIRQVINYSWYVPKLSYEIRASYQPPAKVSIERTAGDIRVLTGTWDLQAQGDYTIAHYRIDLTPGFWVPHWIVRAALRRDLPKMLRALRARAESLQEKQR